MPTKTSQDEAHIVRFEIPPMMRYCAGTCPCTWVTAIALPNIVYFRQLQRVKDVTASETKECYCSVLSGDAKKEEIQYLEYLVPAQSLMGLSSYFAWYYGYGFYGPAKYPLLLYGLTLACHSVALEGDIPTDPKAALAHRAACAVGTFLCTFCFLRVSKFASLLMLPACGVYVLLTNVTFQSINGGNVNNVVYPALLRAMIISVHCNLNISRLNHWLQSNTSNDDSRDRSNINNNRESTENPKPTSSAAPRPALPPPPSLPSLTKFPQYQSSHPPSSLSLPSSPSKRRKKRRKSILKADDAEKIVEQRRVLSARSKLPSRDRRLVRSTNVSFNDTVGVQYPRQYSSSSSSLSSTSLSSASSLEKNYNQDVSVVK